MFLIYDLEKKRIFQLNTQDNYIEYLSEERMNISGYIEFIMLEDENNHRVIIYEDYFNHYEILN